MPRFYRIDLIFIGFSSRREWQIHGNDKIQAGYRDVQSRPYSAEGTATGNFVRAIVFSDDSNVRSHRRKQADHVVQEGNSPDFQGGLVAAHSQAFSTGEYKAADCWIG
jgi:hypothetical protein